MKIVLVGCGRQGLLHLSCLSKIRELFSITIVGVVDRDPRKIEPLNRFLTRLGFAVDHLVHGTDLSDLADKLDLSEAVVDIVTTNSAHHEVAAQAAAAGARAIVVEKPLADTIEHAHAITELDRPVYVMENYIFSAITRFATDYVSTRGLRPCFAKTEFSKDRRQDSSNGRGMLDGYTPHVFSVEMPHQVALANHFLGAADAVEDAWCHDMILPDGRISDHGEGALTLYHGNGVMSYNFSCLQGHHHMPLTYRTARIYCTDRTKIFCHYPTTVDLSGSVLIYRDREIVEKISIVDDSLTENLRYILSSCQDATPPVNNAHFGYAVMNVIDSGKRLAYEYR